MIHRLLELAVQGLGATDDTFALATAATNAVAESDLAECGIAQQELVDRAVTLVEEIRRSDAWRRIAAAAERHVEVPFSIAVAADEIPAGVDVDAGPAWAHAAAAQGGPWCPAVPVLIRGQIDAVFREASASALVGMTDWVILDWKTTSVTPADARKLAEHYRPQLALYARCWAADLHRPLIRPVPPMSAPTPRRGRRGT